MTGGAEVVVGARVVGAGVVGGAVGAEVVVGTVVVGGGVVGGAVVTFGHKLGSETVSPVGQTYMVCGF
ncbi:MAG: hypothetical protein ACE5HH_03415 [Candidatus Hydrothermarchaeales archaeon]